MGVGAVKALLDARRLDLITLGRGCLIVTDAAGSLRMLTWGRPFRWTDPMPNGLETYPLIAASAYPKETRW